MLAPLHNPANASGIEQAMTAFPNTPQVAVFDTAFFRTVPPAAYTYAIDREVADSTRFAVTASTAPRTNTVANRWRNSSAESRRS